MHLSERLAYICDIFESKHNENISLLISKMEDYRRREPQLSARERRAAVLTLEDLFGFVEKKLETELTAMDKVRIVRHPQRICLRDILENVYDNYTEIGSTGEHSIDPSIVIARAYITRRRGKRTINQSVMVIGQEKGHGEEFRNGGTRLRKSCIYVIDFKGSLDAHEVESLREEITIILSVAEPGLDEVLVRLESPGGLVHAYGLAAAQLTRLREKNIRITIAVDKVAASGGYMMACVADKIVAAPFAIVGSIGVVAQVPNIHRLLKKNDIDVEMHTAGQYKRTLTFIGQNTDEGREKFQQELDETHVLFKSFVSQNRPSLDIDKVATGEHWYGTQAKELGLVDELAVSDDLIVAAIPDHEVIQVRYFRRKRLIDKITQSVMMSADRLILRWWQRGNGPVGK